ncbi:MAG: ABC-2 family transporter protein [Minicystis sp.]
MRYLRLLAAELRLSLSLGMQYRWNFLLDGLLSLVWTALGIVPLYIAFHGRPALQGWSYETALVVVGWFTLLKGILEGAVSPSLVAVVEQIRQGTLDFVLLKPADAQFLVSTAKFELWKVIDGLSALVLFGWAFSLLGYWPSASAILLSLVLLLSATLVLYSVWIMVIAAAFFVVRLDNLVYLFGAIFDFARWPVTVFKGFFRIFFTFVIPLGVMTTYPAQALLGTLSTQTALASIGGSLLFSLLARAVWTRSLGRYTSASS